MVQFDPQHVLITQAHMHRLMGSEVATLEILDYFLAKNIKVTLLTCAVGEPVIGQLHQREKLNVLQVNIDDLDTYLLKNPPDLVWVHHGVIPSVLLENRSPKTKFVFNHMSAQLPIEYPVSYPIEPLISNLTLFNAEKIKVAQLETGLYDSMMDMNLQLFENPAPDEFATFQRIKEAVAKPIIGVISNHIPFELLEAIPVLEKEFSINLVGIQSEYGATPQKVTPEFLANFDAVITIGKTVQYSLVAGIPVYCYDHFGGPGWITPQNLAKARFDNFSGRGFARKSSDELVHEIKQFAFIDHKLTQKLQKNAHNDFLLSSRMDAILIHLGNSTSKLKKIDNSAIVAHKYRLLSFAAYVQEWVRSLGEVENMQVRLSHIENELRRAHSSLAKVKKYSGASLLKKLLKNISQK